MMTNALEAFLKFCMGKGPDPRDDYRSLSYLAKQGVWMQLAAFGVKEPELEACAMGSIQRLIEAASGVGKVVGPKVNFNGTKGKDLMDQTLDAGHAVRKAMDALGEAAPHGWDYLPQGAGEYPIAAKQHADRMARLKSVYDELQQVAMLISDQL